MTFNSSSAHGWVLLGAGGQARSLADVIERRGEVLLAVVDPEQTARWPCRVVASDEDGLALAVSEAAKVALAVGVSGDRLRLIALAEQAGVMLSPLLSTTATVSSTARIENGTVVHEHAHVGPYAHIGRAVIVNTSAIIEHDVRVDEGSHVAPGAVVLGGCSLGKSCLVGANATILPSVCVGDQAVIGAGAVVRADVAPGATVTGVHVHSSAVPSLRDRQ